MIGVANKFYVVALNVLFLSCSSGEVSKEFEESATELPNTPRVFQELYDQGIDKYLGTIKPISSRVAGLEVTEHIFSAEDGPVCFTGNQFSMFTRDGSSNSLMIFLQGGGFCSPDVCAAVDTGIPLIPFAILNATDPQNPVASFDLGYIPYCDGTSMAGDVDIDSDADGINDRFFKGAVNLSASLDVIAQRYPSPNKIVLAGNSAGGFAVHMALPLVRKLYPAAQIFIINDSGIGLATPGGFELPFGYWNANAFIPASCSDCVGADGNLTGLHAYQLAQDENIKLAYISSKQDSVTSVPLGGPEYEIQLLAAVAELNDSYPDRFQGLIDNGDAHTYIIRNFNLEIGGITVSDWLSLMIDEGEEWKTIIE